MDANATNRLAEQIYAATEAMRKLDNRQKTPMSVDEAINAMTQVLLAVGLLEQWKNQPVSDD
jgi:hypothetical protein